MPADLIRGWVPVRVKKPRQRKSYANHEVRGDLDMHFRLLAIALCALALPFPTSAQTPDIAAIAKSSGTPDIPGLKMVWLAPWGDVAKAHPWRNVIVHQTEGPAGSARGGASEQNRNPTRRGVMVWVETDGTVYWA